MAGKNAIIHHKEDRILSQRITRGYYYVVLDIRDGEFRFRRGIAVHRLVAQEFHENRLNRRDVDHVDGNKLNNNFENLEWVSHAENARRAFAMGLSRPNVRIKFDREKIAMVFELRKQNRLHKEIAEELGMGISTVTHILLGTRRKKY